MLIGMILFSSLYLTCLARRRFVSSKARFIESVTRSAYMITRPFTLRAARPIVWINAVSERRKPSLSASKIATRETSGKSKPSRKRLPTSTSKVPSRRSRKMPTRSSVSTSECKYWTLTPNSFRYVVKSSDIRFVRVVTRTRSPLSTRCLISPTKSSTCPLVGRTSTSGSTNPVGRMICSTTWSACSIS